MAYPLLDYQDITMRYHAPSGETPVLTHFSFAVEVGEFIAIVGPSGCGKSTLLSLAAGLIKPDEGQVLHKGTPITAPPKDMGYMLQRDHLFPWLSIRDNAVLGLRVRGDKSAESQARVDALLRSTGLWEFRDRFPQQLSGGMRQRAALARTLAVKPEFLLLDEPFSALDSQTRVKLSDEVKGTIVEHGCTALLVTHDISEAISMATRIIVLTHRPATILAEHVIELRGAPLERREHPLFKEYFNLLWKELDVHVD
jgi:NitT/TauT family transport system ATP-binding protein